MAESPVATKGIAVGIGPSHLVLAGLWLIAICTGMGMLIDYETKPGQASTAPDRWPETSRIPAPQRHQLVMFAHPRCPCTRASIGELASIMARAQGRFTARVLFMRPAQPEALGGVENWAKTDLWRSAAAIPGVTPVLDDDGAEARRFGVATSGHTVLYDDDGRLLFSGGITGSRGHSGDNFGRSAVVSLIRDGSPAIPGPTEPIRCAVYGCLLFGGASE